MSVFSRSFIIFRDARSRCQVAGCECANIIDEWHMIRFTWTKYFIFILFQWERRTILLLFLFRCFTMIEIKFTTTDHTDNDWSEERIFNIIDLCTMLLRKGQSNRVREILLMIFIKHILDHRRLPSQHQFLYTNEFYFYSVLCVYFVLCFIFFWLLFFSFFIFSYVSSSLEFYLICSFTSLSVFFFLSVLPILQLRRRRQRQWR